MWLSEPTIRPKDDPSDDSPSEDNPTDGCDWLSRWFCLVVCPKDALKPFDWLIRINLSVWQGVRLVVLTDESDWTRKAPCLSSWTQLIGISNQLVLIRTLLIGRSANQLFHVFFGLLSHAMSDMQSCWRENDYGKTSSLGWRISRSDLFLMPK